MIPRRKAHAYPGEIKEIGRRCQAGVAEDAGLLTRWERAVADFVGVPNAAVVNSGRRGMTLIFRHLGVGPEDEVIVPAYTLKDLIPLIQGLGAKIIPADIDRETLNISPKAVSERITAKTKAILALHAFGSPCDIEEIVTLADRHGLAVIEDCAHSLGASIGGKQTGSFGRAGFFSFETTKPVNTFGGGMVVSSDAALTESVHASTEKDVLDVAPLQAKAGATKTEDFLFRTGLGFPMLYLLASPMWKGVTAKLYRRFQHAPPSNIRYTPIQAEIGLKKLASLSERMGERKRSMELLRSLLSSNIQTQRIRGGCESTWYFFVAVLPCSALRVRKRMLLRGIDAGIEDEIADNCAALLGYKDCPVIDDVYERAMVLPLYEGITEEAIRKIARVLNESI